MRADAAAGAGPGQHQVVQPRVGHEAKALQHLARRGHVQVQPLHAAASSPGATAAAARAAAAAPWRTRQRAGVAHDQARFDVVAGRPASNISRRGSGRRHAGPGLAHEQRLLLPVPPHEGGRRQAAEQGQRCVHVHGAHSGRSACRSRGRRRPCAIIPRMQIHRPLCRHPDLETRRRPEPADRRTDAADRVLRRRRRPAGQGRRGAGRARGRRRSAGATRTRTRLRRLPARTGVLRGPQAVPRTAGNRHDLRGPARRAASRPTCRPT